MPEEINVDIIVAPFLMVECSHNYVHNWHSLKSWQNVLQATIDR